MCSPKNWPPFSPMLPIWPRILPSSRLRNQMWLYGPLAVHGHTVPLRRIEGTDHVALLVEMDHRGRPHTAVCDPDLRLQLNISEIIGTIHEPKLLKIGSEILTPNAALNFFW